MEAIRVTTQENTVKLHLGDEIILLSEENARTLIWRLQHAVGKIIQEVEYREVVLPKVANVDEINDKLAEASRDQDREVIASMAEVFKEQREAMLEEAMKTLEQWYTLDQGAFPRISSLSHEIEEVEVDLSSCEKEVVLDEMNDELDEMMIPFGDTE